LGLASIDIWTEDRSTGLRVGDADESKKGNQGCVESADKELHGEKTGLRVIGWVKTNKTAR
jgi:hypothetical protein